MIDQAEIHRMAWSEDVEERIESVNELYGNFSVIVDKNQAWSDLHNLIIDIDSDVRGRAAEALGSVFPHVPNRNQAYEDIHQLSQDKNSDVRRRAAKALGSAFPHIPDRNQAWADLHRLIIDKHGDVRGYATEALGSTFPHIPDRNQAWTDLHRLTQDEQSLVRWKSVEALGFAFCHIIDRNQAWADLHRLILDDCNYVAEHATEALDSLFPHIPDKNQAWSDMIKLISEVNSFVRGDIIYALSSFYPYIPDKEKACSDMVLLTKHKDRDIRASANHSMGRISIFKATEAECEKDFKKDLEKALKFFEKSSKEATFNNPAEFCLPFYRSFYTLTFKREEAEAEMKKYLKEAKSAVEGSESKGKLLEAVENLGNALKEVHKVRDFDVKKTDLNAYRRYCDRACELLEATEEKAPGASRLIRRGLPIIDERIKGILSEIQEKAKVLCKETKGTSFESLGKDVNNAGQNLLNVRDPIGLEKQVQNMLIVLSSICTSMPEEERGDACEFLKKANDELYIEDKLGSINIVLSKIPIQIRKAIIMPKIEIKNSTNTQVAVGNGNIQEIRTSTKPEYGRDEPEKRRKKITKSAISIDEKIQQKNESIEQILDKWGFRHGHGKREEKKAEIEKWLHRFQLSEFEDAFLILERIQYHDSHTVDGYMEGLSGELKKIFDDDLSEILFYPLGESPASSGGNLLYSYRKELGLPESSFPYVPLKDIDLSGKKAIVFFDDIIGSGNQAIRFAEKHLHDIKIDKYYVALMAFEKGLEKVRNNGCFKKVIVHEIISEEARAFSPESQVFSDAGTRERIKILCEKYGKELYPKHPLGYDDSQALIVFPHNTPNNTLPIIWASDKNEKEPGYIWYPVWERIKRTEKK